ncbi:MAG: PcfJ domain-containing protein [Polaromonas sp.]|nr:PcfJ domain-containing protein [Polaromonas sp.]
MHEEALQNYCPAFGLLPDIAAFAIHPTFGETSPPPAHHWVWKAPPADVGAIHEPGFVFDILQRIQVQLDCPVMVSHDRAGRRVLKVLGCYLFLEQKNKCWRVYEWKYEGLGLLTLAEVPAESVVAQSPPWRWKWLQSLVRPIALEYKDWRWRRGHETKPAAAKRYSQWLLQTLETKLRVDGVRVELTKHLALDPWALKIASRFLRSHDMPHRALMADYNCVLTRRSAFAKLESDAPHLIGLYGALCRARRFPRAGEPLQRLKAYLIANDLSQQAWISIVNAPARFWLIANRYYTGAPAGQVLDLIRCIDVLGFDRTPPVWLLDALLAPHGGPGSRYPSYAYEVCKREAVWRHIVRLLKHIQKPTEDQCIDLKRIIDWAGQTGQDHLTRAQRQAGWRWLVGKSSQWEKRQRVELQSSGKTWWVPANQMMVGDFEFRFLTNPLELWEEGQAMRHCAFDLILGCERGTSWVVSIRRAGIRIATMELRLTDDQWRIHQLRGKYNTNAKKALWLSAFRLLKLLSIHLEVAQEFKVKPLSF